MTNKLNAANAWIFPLLSWGITVVPRLLNLTPGGVVTNLLLALAQLVLLIAGIYVGIIVLSKKRQDYTRQEKIHGTVGLILAGTAFSIAIFGFIVMALNA